MSHIEDLKNGSIITRVQPAMGDYSFMGNPMKLIGQSQGTICLEPLHPNNCDKRRILDKYQWSEGWEELPEEWFL